MALKSELRDLLPPPRPDYSKGKQKCKDADEQDDDDGDNDSELHRLNHVLAMTFVAPFV